MTHNERHLRRKLLHMVHDDVVMLDLEEPVVLEHGDLLALEGSGHVEVIAADENLLEIKARNLVHQMELAWHLGNRHLATQIKEGRIAEALMRMQALTSDCIVGWKPVAAHIRPFARMRRSTWQQSPISTGNSRHRHSLYRIRRRQSRSHVVPDLADLTIYIISVCQGEEIPRKGGPRITRSDLLIINKRDLAPHVAAHLDVMERDATRMRSGKPFLFSDMNRGDSVGEIVDYLKTYGGLAA